MEKIRAITWKEVYTTFTDRNLLIIMIVTPLVLATIIGLAFGGLGGGSGGFSDIPIAVINNDTGVEEQGQTINYGTIFTDLVLSSDEEDGDEQQEDACQRIGDVEGDANTDPVESNIALHELFNAKRLLDADAAREAVDNGDYVAAVIIPAGFSASVSPNIGSDEDPEAASIEVYASSGSPISASIVRSVTEGFVNNVLTSNVAIASSVNTLIETNPSSAARLDTNEEAQNIFACIQNYAMPTVIINQLSVGDDDTDDLSVTSQILLTIGAAQAVFFALFTAQFGVISIVEERRLGTLQRLIVSPTPRNYILIGKLTGTFFTVLFQIAMLMIALMFIASLLEGALVLIWGTNIIGIVGVVIAVSLSVCGLGILMAGLAKTPEQVGAVGSILNILLAIAGGAFGVALPSPIRETSMIYWGVDALDKLAAGNTDILLNLVVLVVEAGVLFLIGSWIFSRRLDI